MSDILVPVPLTEADHFWDPAQPEDGRPTWVMSRRPKNFEPGDRIWFQLAGVIVARVVVHEINEDSFICAVTDRRWSGWVFYWNAGDLEKLARPLPGAKCLRSFRYLDRVLAKQKHTGEEMKILTEAVEMVPVTSINPHPKNPRQGDLEVIKRSIQKNGFYGAIVVQKSSGFILAGNHRFMAACSLGMTHVPVVYVDVDDDNALASLLEGLQGADMLEDTGYDDDDLASLLAGIGGDDDDAPVHDDEDDGTDKRAETERMAEEWGTALGQVWAGEKDGQRFRIFCGDATTPEGMRRAAGDMEVRWAMTDPPYGISIVKKRKAKDTASVGSGGALQFKSEVATVGGDSALSFSGSIGSDNIVRASNYAPVAGDGDTEAARRWWSSFKEVFPEADALIWGGNYFTDFLPPSMHWIIWDKQNAGTHFADAEMAWVSTHAAVRLYQWLWNGLARKGARADEGKRRMHPTQKPVGLHVQLLHKLTPDHAVIMDCFLGSGTTMMAALRAGRSSVGAELSPAYCALILDRMREAGVVMTLED